MHILHLLQPILSLYHFVAAIADKNNMILYGIFILSQLAVVVHGAKFAALVARGTE